MSEGTLCVDARGHDEMLFSNCGCEQAHPEAQGVQLTISLVMSCHDLSFPSCPLCYVLFFFVVPQCFLFCVLSSQFRLISCQLPQNALWECFAPVTDCLPSPRDLFLNPGPQDPLPYMF